MHQPRVFISYSHEDAEWVRRFAEALRQQDVQVWLDDWEMLPGDSIAAALESGLRGSDAIVSVLTRENARRPNVMFELGVTLGTGKPIIPVISPDLSMSEIPFTFLTRRFLTRSEPHIVAQEVAEAVKSRAA